MRGNFDLFRWSWRHHPLIVGVWVLCVVAVGVGGLGRALSGDRPGWFNTMFLVGIVGGFICLVMLMRRYPDAD